MPAAETLSHDITGCFGFVSGFRQTDEILIRAELKAVKQSFFIQMLMLEILSPE